MENKVQIVNALNDTFDTAINKIVLGLLLLFLSCNNHSDLEQKKSSDEIQVTTTSVNPPEPTIDKGVSTKNYNKDFTGEWILSSSFPVNNDFKILQNIITDSKNIDDMCDCFYAKKSANFKSDKRFLLTCTSDKTSWSYYVINIDLLSVEKVSITKEQISPPKINNY